MKTRVFIALALFAGAAISMNAVFAQSADNAVTNEKKQTVQKTKPMPPVQKKEAMPVIQSTKSSTSNKAVTTKPATATKPKTTATGPGVKSKTAVAPVKTKPVNPTSVNARTTNKSVNDVKSLDKSGKPTTAPKAKPATEIKDTKTVQVKTGTKMTPAKAEAIKKSKAENKTK
ncbi:MAG TPA: hypothetical protein PLP88_08500 [Bacteroidales bacterium]|nr:hypothetical protein [Bacteroidales bacterium]